MEGSGLRVKLACICLAEAFNQSNVSKVQKHSRLGLALCVFVCVSVCVSMQKAVPTITSPSVLIVLAAVVTDPRGRKPQNRD